MLLKASVALAPALVLLAVFAQFDVFKLVRPSMTAALLLGGAGLAAAAYVLNGALMQLLPVQMDLYSRYFAPVVEETLKASALLFLFASNRIGFKLDAAVMGFAVGSGFAVLENLYQLSVFPGANTGVWMVRGFGTAVMHAGATALFAVLSHEMSERQLQRKATLYRFNPLLYLPGLAVATAVHSTFNHFPGVPLQVMVATLLLIPLTLFLVFHMGERASHQWLLADNESHEQVLAQIESGRFAQSETGRAVINLSKKFNHAVAADVFEYIKVHTELALRAEQLLLARKLCQEPECEPEDDRQKFLQLRALERRIGKAALAELRPHLHFTRNDLWEMHHLEQQAEA